MATRTQAHRHAVITTPLGDDVLLLRSMSASEQMGRMFRYELTLYADNESAVKLDKILGQNVTIRMDISPSGQRYFNGHVSRFAYVDSDGRGSTFRATVVPWLWFLTRTADCRIFQGMTVPDIIKKVFRDKGFSDFDDGGLTGSYTAWEYCVQYRETDFNFVSRLMEQEGIYYYFDHADGKHTLMLADSRSAHQPFPGYDKIPYRPKDQRLEDRQYVWNLSMEQEVQAGAYALNDFDFTAPRKQLRAVSKIVRQHGHADLEIYDYPGEYEQAGDGNQYAKVRIEEQHAAFESVRADSDAQGICPGYTFELTDCPREDQNRELLVVAADYHVHSDDYDSNGSSGPDFHCTFRAMDPKEPFRPARVTPKPTIQGPQTAIVVGPGGEEIHTDEHGRVKVQFHWDRYGESNEKSSCWVRVSQPWAGKGWGGITIPRIGHEVIVEFLEGDPDRPIITGRVYNGDNPVPYALPANKTQSGLKSRSSPGGSTSNFNEIRMEDKKGSEQLYIHAEKNEDIVVENDKTEDVGHDETIKIGNDRTETVGHNETITVQNDRTDTVNGNETRTVVKDRTRTVNANETVTVALMRTHTVGINEAITIGAAQEVTVGAAQTITVGAVQSTTVGANQSNSVGGNRSVSVGGKQMTSIGGAHQTTVGGERKTAVSGNETLAVSKKITINAGDEIAIETGEASIVMKKDGTIDIKGKNITINGSGQIGIKASKDVVIKGSKVLQN